MPIHIKNDIAFYTFSIFDAHHIRHGIFMRNGGCSLKPWQSLNLATSVGDTRDAVITNRRKITNTLSLKANSIYDVWQVHSNKVITTNQPRALDTPHIKADGVVTNNPEVTLMMLFADCVPILFYDPLNKVAAIAHAGWQGTSNGVVIETVNKMRNEYGTKPEKLLVGIGPSICVKHYEIGLMVEKSLRELFNKTEEIIDVIDGKQYLDLQKANKILLNRIGVNNIIFSEICTACHTDDWFSHRAENGKTGRFAAVLTVLETNADEH